MAVFDCSAEMKSYHQEEVSLPKRQQDEMRSRRDAGRSRLKQGLAANKKPSPIVIATQGSYAMRTMVQDKDLDYDIDDGVYFASVNLKDNAGSPMSPSAARQMVRDALVRDERLKLDAVVRDHCVRQAYPEGYHIDIPVYRTKGEGSSESYELASGNNWKESDARAVTEWFTDIVGDLNTGEEDGSQLRRIVRLTKKYARSRSAWKAKMTSGICITKLIVEKFPAVAGRDDESLVLTWKAIRDRLNASLRINHPVLAGESLSKGDGDQEVAYLRDKLTEALTELSVLSDPSCTKTTACKAWDKVFDTTFFSGRSGGGTGGKGGPPLIKTSDRPPRRDDGDRRFG